MYKNRDKVYYLQKIKQNILFFKLFSLTLYFLNFFIEHIKGFLNERGPTRAQHIFRL